MYIWLPPSEGKCAPLSGPPLNIGDLFAPELTHARAAVMNALQLVSSGPRAAHILGLGPKSAAAAAANLRLTTSACTPAIDLYTGVLYENLDYRSLTTGISHLDRALIQSALFGFLRPTDLIPMHRLAIGVTLPELGPLTRYWRAELARHLPPFTGELILDCRPASYQSAFPANQAHIVEIAAVSEQTGRPISHMAKKWRGRVARRVLSEPAFDELHAPSDIVALISQLPSESQNAVVRVAATPPRATRSGGSVTRVVLTVRAPATPSDRPDLSHGRDC